MLVLRVSRYLKLELGNESFYRDCKPTATKVPGRQITVMMEMKFIFRLSSFAAMEMLKFVLVSACSLC